MKIPTSTSFVMAATASLALQSSARAVPPDSPELSRASPRLTGRAVAMGQFAGRAPRLNLRSDSRPTSPRRGLKIRESPGTDPIDMSLGDTAQLADDIGLGLGLNSRAVGMDVDKSVGESVSVHARQVPAPDLPVDVPGTVGSLTDVPGQVAGGVIQQGSGIPSTVTGTVGGALPQGLPLPLPSLAPSGLPAPLPVPLPISPSIPPNVPLPVVRRDTDLPNPFPVVGQVPGTAPGTIGSTAGGVIGGVGGTPGQVIGGTPVGSALGSTAVNPLATIQDATDGLADALPGAGEAAGAATENIVKGLADPLMQVADTAGGVAGSTPAGTLIPGGLQGNGQKAAANAPVDGTRPSDYSASSVEGGLMRRQEDSGVVEDDDGDAVGMTSPTSPSASPPIDGDAPASSDGNAYDESEYETDMSKRQNLPIEPPLNPFSVLPVPVPSLPVGNLPFPSGAPVAAPIPIPVPSLPVSPPVSLPIAVPSGLPVSPPVDPTSFIPAKRKRIESPIDPPLPEDFAAPNMPIEGDVPPLLRSRSSKEDVGAGVSASVENPPTATSTVQPGTTMLPPRPTNAQNAPNAAPNAPGAPAEGAVSATVEDKVSASRTVQPGTSMVPTTRPVSTSTTVEAVMTTAATPNRRRLFRFNRMQNA